jgi:hypothetical protein
VIQVSLGPWNSVALTAAVSEAGGIGTVGTALMRPDQVVWVDRHNSDPQRVAAERERLAAELVVVEMVAEAERLLAREL